MCIVLIPDSRSLPQASCAFAREMECSTSNTPRLWNGIDAASALPYDKGPRGSRPEARNNHHVVGTSTALVGSGRAHKQAAWSQEPKRERNKAIGGPDTSHDNGIERTRQIPGRLLCPFVHD